MPRRGAVERLERRVEALAPSLVVRAIPLRWHPDPAERERVERERIAEARRQYGDDVFPILVREDPPRGTA